jgi:hypothetical protein
VVFPFDRPFRWSCIGVGNARQRFAVGTVEDFLDRLDIAVGSLLHEPARDQIEVFGDMTVGAIGLAVKLPQDGVAHQFVGLGFLRRRLARRHLASNAGEIIGRTASPTKYAAQSGPPAPMLAGQGSIETGLYAQFWMMRLL